jgi:acetyl esterase/lipase
MKKMFLVILFILSIIPFCFAQNFTLPLWEGNIPNYQKTDEVEISDSTDIIRISNVQNPEIDVYLPSNKDAIGKAVVICPGGGYEYLAYDFEGSDVAKFFNSQGIAAVILKYRLPVSKSNIVGYKSPLLDVQRAMRLMRYHASEWNIKKDEIGIMGFSAGGHLASTLGTHFDYGNKNSTDPVETFYTQRF